LASISSRFYGHPAAAAALWNANRDLIPNPDLLAIGAEIRLPPPWAVPGSASSQHGGVRSIEPPPTGVFPRQVEALPASAAWLDGRQAPPAATTRPAPVAGTVRLAPGETLETLAERFYGDRRAAARIWEANRDRLRSPELVVQGMELRLP
jgi:nucleoid-associated protein YgaU